MRIAAAGVCHLVRLFLLILLSALPSASVDAEDHRIEPGESPQAVMDRAAAGDRLVFLPGLHQHAPGRHRALLYVDKSIEIELQEGAVLKLADDVCQLEPEGEVTTDQDGPETYGIRIGHGTQSEYIENVRIYGRGTIDLNSSRNAQPSGLVRNINACVLVHGRVRGVTVGGITMQHTNRSVMCYGEHTGEFLAGGQTGAGESFDAEDNVIRSDGQAIHCWRHSKNGVVADNLRIHDNSGRPVVVVNAPRGWQPPEPPVLRNNRNHLNVAADDLK